MLELTPPEMVDCAAEAGFSHVDIRLLPATPTEPQYDIVGDTPLPREGGLADTSPTCRSSLTSCGAKRFELCDQTIALARDAQA